MPLLLECPVQNYAWGKFGMESAVAALGVSGKHIEDVDSTKPYSELWMGTHVNGPAKLVDGSGLLSDYLKENPKAVGSPVEQKFGAADLPFLFKVLSVNKSLSIQAHPNKAHAEQLHAARPDIYKDPNHKPELCVALTDVQALCSFKPIDQIAKHLGDVPELCQVIGEENCHALRSAATCDDSEAHRKALHSCFRALMTCNVEVMSQQLHELIYRLDGSGYSSLTDDLKELVLRLHRQFPGDVGVFSAFFLNHMHLKPGQAMFLRANLPHAYLQGDLLEIMARSDNVVRAGLTPKLKDVETLCEMLDYNSLRPEQNVFTGENLNDNVRLFDPPVPDFALEVIKSDGGQVALRPLESASIILIVEGCANSPIGELCTGRVVFLSAGEIMNLTSNEHIHVARAYCSC